MAIDLTCAARASGTADAGVFDAAVIAVVLAEEVGPGVGPSVGFEIVDGCAVMGGRLPI